MPDLIHILLYGSVRGELAGACHIQDGALRPVVLVAVSGFHSLLCLCVGLEVLEDEVGVCLGRALGVQQGIVCTPFIILDCFLRCNDLIGCFCT